MQPPAPTPPRPLTDRERYRAVLAGFTGELAALYRDPHAARRSFAADAYARGTTEAVRTLASRPEEYGRLRVLVRPDHAAEAARWAQIYGRWQEGRTRPAARVIADLYRAAARVDAADRALRDAAGEVGAAEAARRRYAELQGHAKGAYDWVRERAREVYADPDAAMRAIEEYARVHGRKEMDAELRARPERFGKLRAEERRFLGIRYGLDYGAARRDARILADSYDGAFAAWAAQPTPEEMARVRAAEPAARIALDAAHRARRALPATPAREYAKEAARLLRQAMQTAPAHAGKLMRQLAPMLSKGAFTLACKALEEPERERRRDRDVGLGF